MTFCQIENVLEYNGNQTEIVNNTYYQTEIVHIQNEIIINRSDSTLSNASTIICDDI